MGRSPIHWLSDRDDLVRRTSSRRRRWSWSGSSCADHSHHRGSVGSVVIPSWQPRIAGSESSGGEGELGVGPVGRTAVGTPGPADAPMQPTHRSLLAIRVAAGRSRRAVEVADGRADRRRAGEDQAHPRRRPTRRSASRAATPLPVGSGGSSTSALVIQARTSVAPRMPTRDSVAELRRGRSTAAATSRRPVPQVDASTSDHRSTAREPHPKRPTTAREHALPTRDDQRGSQRRDERSASPGNADASSKERGRALQHQPTAHLSRPQPCHMSPASASVGNKATRPPSANSQARAWVLKKATLGVSAMADMQTHEAETTAVDDEHDRDTSHGPVPSRPSAPKPRATTSTIGHTQVELLLEAQGPVVLHQRRRVLGARSSPTGLRPSAQFCVVQRRCPDLARRCCATTTGGMKRTRTTSDACRARASAAGSNRRMRPA